MSLQVFYGCDIFDGARIHAGAALVVEDGVVAAVVPASEAPGGAVTRLDGGVLAPGFIDLQVNGGGGIMLNDAPDLDGIRRICATHGRLGVTALLPTLITDTPAVTARRARRRHRRRRGGGPRLSRPASRGAASRPAPPGRPRPRLIRPMTEADLARCSRPRPPAGADRHPRAGGGHARSRSPPSPRPGSGSASATATAASPPPARPLRPGRGW